MKAAKLIKQTNCTCELVTTIELVHPKPGIELKEQQSSLSFPNVGPDLQCWECVHASAFDLPWEKSMFSHTNPRKTWNPSGWPARHEVLNGLVHEAWRLDAALALDTILDTILDSPFVNQFIVTGSFAAIHIPEGASKWPLQPFKKSSLHAPEVGSRESQHPSRLGRVQTLWSDIIMMMWWQWVWVSHPSTLSDP